MWYSELETVWISLIWWPLMTSIRQAKLCSDNSIFESNYCFFFFIRSSTRIFYLFCFGFLSLPSSLFCSPFDQNFFVWFFFILSHIFERKKIAFCSVLTIILTCYKEKIVLVIEKIWGANLRQKAETFQNFWGHWNNSYKQ